MRERGRERDSEKVCASLHWLISQMATELGLGHARARSLELQPGLPVGGRGPSTWSIFYCFPKCDTGEVESEIQELGHEPMLILNATSKRLLNPLCHSDCPEHEEKDQCPPDTEYEGVHS